MNEMLTCRVLQSALSCGVVDFVVCPGIRNSSFVEVLREEKRVSTYYWPEERSAAFFALGRSRLTRRPTAVVTTSGTAAGELLPAAMEAYYSGVPLLLITADRPRRFRGSGAPQSAEQAGLFGIYARYFIDMHGDHACDLSGWNQRAPAHVNVCLEEPQGQPPYSGQPLVFEPAIPHTPPFDQQMANEILDRFLLKAERPLVVVSSLDIRAQEEVKKFLIQLNAPVMLEGVSGLREDPLLQCLRCKRTESVLESAKELGYNIDSILRIGGVPTHRIWRDAENLKNRIQICSISELPFSGISWNRHVICGSIKQFFHGYKLAKRYETASASLWLADETIFHEHLLDLFSEESQAEPSLIHHLSRLIPEKSHVFLGNSLPIREWDLAAIAKHQHCMFTASRGLNGIDGQVATFLGMCRNDCVNWAILGDLTLLYDMAGFWILPKLEGVAANIVVINNGGGQLFAKILPQSREMLNEHRLSFRALAQMWGLEYECWEDVPENFKQIRNTLIEIIPNEAATKRFWTKIKKINKDLLEKSFIAQVGK